MPKLKNQLHQAKENIAKECAERSSMSTKEDSQEEEASHGIETRTFTTWSTTEGIQDASDR
jgi:hypothetical protein